MTSGNTFRFDLLIFSMFNISKLYRKTVVKRLQTALNSVLNFTKKNHNLHMVCNDLYRDAFLKRYFKDPLKSYL